MNGWSLVYEGFEPSEEPLREALCTLGNGSFATRGAAEESRAEGCHYPGTYLASGYDRLMSEVAGRTVENEDLVNWPNWLPLSFRCGGGEWLDLTHVNLTHYRQVLHLKTGILERHLRFGDAEGHDTTLQFRRLVHMESPHLAAIELIVTPHNWSGLVEVRSALDGRVVNGGIARYGALRGDHLQALGTRRVSEDTIALMVQTKQSHIEMAQAARTRALGDDGQLLGDGNTSEVHAYIEQRLSFEVSEGRPVRIEKVVAVFTSRDRAIADCEYAATRAISEDALDFAALARTHAEAWERLWYRCDVSLDCDERTQLVLRLHIFHLLQTVSIHTIDLDAGVPARGLHGEAYRGHVFWDELFIFPFLNLRIPEITRALLMYRYRRLPEARRAAIGAGYTGAMYPWQSGSDGREETQVLHLNPQSGRWGSDNSHLQRHINAAIAYNVWQYYQATGDTPFMTFYGAELFLEIARFLASLTTYNTPLERYEIRGVMGPDEYHDAYPGADEPGLRNNAYTNLMVVWVLWRARDLLDRLAGEPRDELCAQLDLSDEELERWDAISRRMRVVFHDGGIISQFEGYDRLAELDWHAYTERYGNIQRLDRLLEAEGDTPNRYKVSKQADVLMLFYLFSSEELANLFSRLGYPFEPETIPRNIEYYLRRTSDGSTLSGVIRAWLRARGNRRESWDGFSRALESDVADVQGGTTPEGIHLGAMAGTVDIVQRGYTGIEMRNDVLWLNPHLPAEVCDLSFHVRYQGHWLRLEINHARMRVVFERGWDEVARIGFGGKVYDFRKGESREFVLSPSG
jgi:alpha,alpha-trehalase